MPIRGSHRPAARVPVHHEPGEGEEIGSERADPAALRAPRSDAFDRPQMPVSLLDAGLNLDRSGTRVNEAAPLKHSLSAREILLAAPERKDELVRRYCAFLSTLAGGATSKTQQPTIADLELAHAGAMASLQNGTLKLSAAGQTATLDIRQTYTSASAAAALDTALLTLERLLFTAQGVDPRAAELTLFLVGGDGLLTRGKRMPLRAEEAFTNPKLLCWDFNGTVEKFGDGRPRGDLSRTSRAMQRRGATSLITTTIAPEKPEAFMLDHRMSFGGYYGKEEVRPTKGNKSYRLLAEAHGISEMEAPARMVILGDSKTDIPSDLPGTLFLHNDAMTPAPALELLLNTLDQLGQGSFRDGLNALTHGPLKPGEKRQDLQVGDLKFDVEMRDGSNNPLAKFWVPTLCRVRVALDATELTERIANPPDKSDVNGRARMHLALEHLAEGLTETDVPSVIKALQNTQGARAGLAAVDRRLAQRETEIENGRKSVETLSELFASPAPLQQVANEVLTLLVLGDHEVAHKLPEQVSRLSQIAEEAEPQVRAALEEDAKHMRMAAQALVEQGVPFYAGAALGNTGQRLERITKSPLSLSAEQRKKTLEFLQSDEVLRLPGGREAGMQILQQLSRALADASEKVEEIFALRKSAQAEFDQLVLRADEIAQRRELAFQNIRTARSGTKPNGN